MPSTGIVRSLDSLGRIVIPKETRVVIDLRDNDRLEITLGDECLVLKKFVSGCIFCGSTSGLHSFRGKSVCRRCLSDAKRYR